MQDGNLEVALRYYHTIGTSGLIAELRTIQAIVELCADQGHARLAIELASAYEQNSARRIESGVWMACLSASAMDLWVSQSVKQ